MLSLYLHIPFCRKRCPYCDFYLVAGTRLMEPFFDALAKETACRSHQLEGQQVGAVHFGGGTPSLAPPALLAGWLESVARYGRLSAGAEITLEANPEDLSLLRLDELRAIGITRLSLGVQSFMPEKLRALGRAHTAPQAFATVAAALERFDSVSLDLICGAPGESSGLWRRDLEAALSTGAQHISVYMLAVEPKTLLHRDVGRGVVGVPGEEQLASFYLEAAELLCRAGYVHYEISNFALAGHHSRYNLATWKRKPYLGYGPSAHSFIRSGSEEVRAANLPSLSGYLADPGGGARYETLTAEERFTEEVYLTLRINGGLDVAFLRKGHNFADRLDAAILDFERKGWVQVADGRLRLTATGFLFADLIAGELLFGEHPTSNNAV